MIIIKSTYFQRKDIYKGTWRALDGRCMNQKDHVLVDIKDGSCVINIRTYRGMNINSDHFFASVLAN